MPKLKTKSGAKKRFKLTGTGKEKFNSNWFSWSSWCSFSKTTIKIKI